MSYGPSPFKHPIFFFLFLKILILTFSYYPSQSWPAVERSHLLHRAPTSSADVTVPATPKKRSLLMSRKGMLAVRHPLSLSRMSPSPRRETRNVRPSPTGAETVGGRSYQATTTMSRRNGSRWWCRRSGSVRWCPVG